MRERPILFSGPMVRAILDGRKTQTRRVVTPQPEKRDIAGAFQSWAFKAFKNSWMLYPNAKSEILNLLCPYGKPGDRLWVREAFGLRTTANSFGRRGYDDILYRASEDEERMRHFGIKWKPSIFMPREHSRVTLQITNVRVARLQKISEADAKAEGVRDLRDGSGCFAGREGPGKLVTPWLTATEAFADGWDSLNAQRGYLWESNPWVWVIEFKRVEQKVKAA